VSHSCRGGLVIVFCSWGAMASAHSGPDVVATLGASASGTAAGAVYADDLEGPRLRR